MKSRQSSGALWLFVSVSAAGAIGYMGNNALPIMFGSLMDGRKLGEEKTGVLMSLELISVALGSFALALWVGRLSRSAAAIFGAVLGLAGCLLAAWVEPFWLLVACRMMAGFGAGLVLASGNAAAASAENPDRLYALVGVVGAAFAAIIIATLSGVVNVWSYRGGYVVLAAIYLLSIPFLARLPHVPIVDSVSISAHPPGPRWSLLLTVISVFVFWFADQSLWAVSERIGLRTGLSLDQVGMALAGGLLAGLVGGALSSVIGTRFGRVLPLILGLTSVSLCRWGVVVSTSPTLYVILQLAWAASFFFSLPYLMGTAAHLDHSGRWTAVAGAMSMVGTALGPYAAGAIVERWGYGFLAWFVLLFSFGALALILPVVLASDREDAAAPRPSPVPASPN